MNQQFSTKGKPDFYQEIVLREEKCRVAFSFPGFKLIAGFMLALFLVFPCVFLSAQTGTHSQFVLTGKLKNIPKMPEHIYIEYVSANNRIMDSAQVKKGEYKFTGDIAEPTFCRLSTVNRQLIAQGTAVDNANDEVNIFLSPDKMEVTHIDSFSNIVVKGSAAHTDYKEFEKIIQPYNDSMQAFFNDYKQYSAEGNVEKAKEIEIKATLFAQEIRGIFRSFIQSHPSSFMSFLLLQQYAGNDLNVAETEPLFDRLTDEVKSYPSVVQFKRMLDIAKRTSIGQMAADFTQNDTLGNPVSLSSLRGKYLLVDFWASWCQPCRIENPNVVEAFNRYKDKGFFVLGVSLDRPGAEEAWLKAIHDDGLTWTHVSDLQFWNNAVAVMYGIQSIPQNLLLDPTGKIIGKNLRGQELLNTLEGLLGNKE